MPRVKLSTEFKDAIAGLSPKEKNKLLFRLIAKDDKLAEKLHFELMEMSETIEERRSILSGKIDEDLSEATGFRYSAGRVSRCMRSLSGQISRHIYVTKDKYGEVQLNLEMLLTAVRLFGHKMNQYTSRKSQNLNTYIIRRTQKILQLIEKLHEDYHLDFESDLNLLGEQLQEIPAMKREAAIQELDLERLIS
ncbi:MAG: hypothetical protein GYB31_05935 [Bacteroidetes bacterium]|nr:hypothetical protein [Bacteroidota bacterium]